MYFIISPFIFIIWSSGPIPDLSAIESGSTILTIILVFSIVATKPKYWAERFRFFFPLHSKDFLLLTELGNIKTHLSPNGYISSGLRQWFMLNGPLMPNDTITVRLLDDALNHYELSYEKNKDTLWR